ncbi:MAG: M81 family metallopeptidase [Beutenbergiaceae bacterium]
MKVLITEFRQESNSLSPFQSDLAFWRRNGWTLLPGLTRAAHEDTGSAVAGMISELAVLAPTAEIVFGPAFYAQSGGTATTDVLDAYLEQLAEVIRHGGEFDVLLFSFHGALQTTNFDDTEAEVLRRVRDLVGQRPVVAASCDLHGYISRQFAEYADVICGYQTYPHVDFEETGRRTVRLACRMVGGEPLVLAWSPVPMIVSASAYNSMEGRFADLLQRGQQLVGQGAIVDFTIFQMQPWLDVSTPGSAVVVMAADSETAANWSAALGQALYDSRHSFTTTLTSIDDTIDIALRAASTKPVILVDSADSNNAGAAGDSMAVVERLLARQVQPRAATVVNDPLAVVRAGRLGVGATAEFEIGGMIDPRAPRVTVTAQVRSLHIGTFRPQIVGHTGDEVDIGRAAVLRCGEIDILVCEHIAGNGDPQLYRAFGIEPAMYDLIVVKANTSFRDGYRGIAGTIVLADTPGAASANIAGLPFDHMPKTIYPWTDDEVMVRAEVVRQSATGSAARSVRRTGQARHPAG